MPSAREGPEHAWQGEQVRESELQELLGNCEAGEILARPDLTVLPVF